MQLVVIYQGRARKVEQVLLGWYEIPSQLGAAINIVVNPSGAQERSEPRCVPCTAGTSMLTLLNNDEI